MFSYHGTNLTDPKATRRVIRNLSKKILAQWKGVDNLSLLGIGASGISVAAQLSLISGIPWGFFRKPGDNHHHGDFVHGPLELPGIHRVILVDDFISEGYTILGLAKKVRDLAVNSKVVGVALLYNTVGATCAAETGEWQETIGNVPVIHAG